MLDLKAVLLIAFVSLPVLALPTSSSSGPPGFNITSLTYAGNACPPGSTEFFVSNDRSAITGVFSDFFAETGPSVDPTLNNRSCQVSLNVHVPVGYRFSAANIAYNGLVDLGDEVVANFFATYSLEGRKASAYSPYTGPVSSGSGSHYRRTDEFDFDAQTTCGGDVVLYVEPSLKVDNTAIPSESALLTADTIDLNLFWRKC
ncbi:hypothetical protein CPB83DRAFT_862019 [Crepidotus variabilis]|uniref:Secreted protein n=1 Tax=Crepidotus variabilis TaxID=179855 RepID=A0A9P6E798_9AGAR|nr:hypothetical protein CPB83DRAFT_862019 [Crepidotus variabilis]